jgi:hypothetical protein
MRHTATAVALAAVLALAGCTTSEPDKPAVTVTATKTPELSAAEQKQACVDAWLAVMTADDYDPDEGLDARPGVCEELPGQAGMYAEALQARNQANRDEIAECVEDPACTSMPIP